MKNAKEEYMKLKKDTNHKIHDPLSSRSKWLNYLHSYSIHPYNLDGGTPNREPGKFSETFGSPALRHPKCSGCHSLPEYKPVCKDKIETCMKGNFVVNPPDKVYLTPQYNVDYEMTTGY